MRRTLAMLTLILTASTLVHAADSKPAVTVENLLDRMVDLRWLATPPAPGERTIQFSSYDRATKLVDGKIVNPFANGDAGHYLRIETKNGAQEWVLADDDGPGYVSRIWSANPAGELRIYIDGSESPALAADFAKLTNGEIPPFVHPFGHDASRGRNLYFPFPFAKHIKITTTKGGQYYQVSVAHLPAATVVESYSPEVLKRAADKTKSVGQALTQPRDLPAQAAVEEMDGEIAPGETSTRFLAGSGLLRGGRIKIESAERDIALARSLLTITFNDAKTPQVAVPLGDFFGSGPGVNAFQTAVSAVAKDGTMTMLWPMPFTKGCEISLTNGSSKPMTIHAELAVEELPKTAPTPLTFHARWKLEDKIQTIAGNGTKDWRTLTAKGAPGRFVGLQVNVFNPVTAWWGEGDEKVYVDGELFPSTIGTGTEDYFGYAWCDPHTYSWPFHSESRCDGPGNRGNTSNVRYQILDAIPWQSSLAFDMEIWHWAAVKLQYASIAYFYAADGVAAEPGVPDLSPREVYSVESIPVFREKGAIEGEALKVKARTADEVQNQDMTPWSESWSGASQLWWTCHTPGAKLTLTLPVAQDGTYDLSAAFTRAKDYGIAQLALDGKPLGEPLDFYAPEVKHSGAVKLGRVALKSGDHELTVTMTAKNPKSTSYLFGLDWIKLQPVQP